MKQVVSIIHIRLVDISLKRLDNIVYRDYFLHTE